MALRAAADRLDPLRVFSAFFDETGTAPDADLLWIEKAALDALTHAADGSIFLTLAGEKARDPYLWAFHDAVIETTNQVDHIPGGA